MATVASSVSSRFRLGGWLVLPAECAIENARGRVPLEPRLMDVLVVLCERAGEVVSAEQLLIECWRGTFYGDNPVHKTIAQLRRALGDSATAPRYLATIRKRGYRIVAKVTFPEEYRAAPASLPVWGGGCPYVGLGAYGSAHRYVFFGRTRAQAAVLSRLRSRLREGCGFVLLLGPSGCGKTSLIQAGVLPLLQQEGGFDGCRVLSASTLDALRLTDGAAAALADGLLGWEVGGEPVFFPAERSFLVELLESEPTHVALLLDERLSRRAAGGLADDSAVVLLVIDQLERAFTAGATHALERCCQMLSALISNGRIAVIASCRDDFYQHLGNVPALAELKSGDGTVDIPLLTAGELAQIIRAPALAAGLRFDTDPHTAMRLDDVLRDEAIAQPQPLPLLAHALVELYQRREGGSVLSFAALHDIGGLAGALGQRAEATFAMLPPASRQRLPVLLRRMVALGPDETVPVGRRVAWSALADDDERRLAEAMVEHRLFVAERSGEIPAFAAAHESLFRNWPRARDWVTENRRLLLARTRLEQAFRRWCTEGRRADFLLPSGAQLDDGEALLNQAHAPLPPDIQDFVRASARRRRRQRGRWIAGIAVVIVLSLATAVAGTLALFAQREAEQRRSQAEGLVGFMLGDLTERLRGLGKLDVLDAVGNEAMRYLVSLPADPDNARTQLLRIRASRQIGEIRLARAESAPAEAFAHASDLARALTARAPDDAEAWTELGLAEFWLGQIPFQESRYADAATHWQRYLEAARRVVALQPKDPAATLELSYALNNLATLDLRENRHAAARLRFTESATLKRAAAEAAPDDDAILADLADTLTWLGTLEEVELALPAAATQYEAALTTLGIVRHRRPDDPRWRHREALARMHVARIALMRGERSVALANYDAARGALVDLAASDPSNVAWQHDAALASIHNGTASEFAGDIARARSLTQSGLGAISALLEKSPNNVTWRRLQVLARWRSHQLDPAAPESATGVLDVLVAEQTAVLARAPQDSQSQRLLQNLLAARAEKATSELAASEDALHLLASLDGDASARDATSIDLRQRALILLNRKEDARALQQRLDRMGYRHPDYLRFARHHSP
ncbi:winged helix-turn-helix domain-containing protein [Tahibacter amnicola]|uniref:Winged helix-turn-helix domain-containing protein n=1 Tax=Tahibacter amnicola TaxID=2976241 RepID=A0ABY6BDC9_9GAMM|nr:winged helix-turn-helix domain-containing protein [Tahibacter amnicola]UXI67859.1 winged helix-turn-helix domain-containing protein [Tahibacter amnicola]